MTHLLDAFIIPGCELYTVIRSAVSCKLYLWSGLALLTAQARAAKTSSVGPGLARRKLWGSLHCTALSPSCLRRESIAMLGILSSSAHNKVDRVVSCRYLAVAS